LHLLHGRTPDTTLSPYTTLFRSKERRIALTYNWVPDELLNDQLVAMARGDAAARKTPALVFCFNRDECWSIAEQLKGLALLGDRSEEHTSELQSRENLVCRLLLE